MFSPSGGLGEFLAGPTKESTGQRAYSFGIFELNLSLGTLYREGREVDLRPKNFDLLLYLVQNRGRLITKQECLDGVWPDCAVTENVLTQGVAEIRKILADDPHTPSFIKTVPRRGYIFISDVRMLDESATDEAQGMSLPAEPRGRSWWGLVWKFPGATWMFTSILLTGVLLAGTLVWLPPRFSHGWFRETVSWSNPHDNVLAVIPFEVHSDTPGYEWLGRGIADMVSSALTSSPHLSVQTYDRLSRRAGNPGRTAGPFRRAAALETVKNAGIGRVVTGTLNKREGSMYLEVQLIDALTQKIESRTWTEVKSLDRILDAVEEICVQVLQTLLREEGELSQVNGRYGADVTTSSLDAYQHYVAALTKFQYGGKLGADAALVELQKAVRIDPSFAMAHFKIAELKEWRRVWGYSSESPREAVLEAARYASDLPEKERLLIEGLKALTADDDPSRAVAIWKELERLYPPYALDVGIPVRIVEIYLDWGELDEVIDYAEPLLNHPALNAADRARLKYHLSSAFLHRGDLNEALYYAERSVALWPLKDSPVLVLYLVKLGQAKLFTGNREEALKYFDQARSLAGEDAVYLTNIAWGYYFAGEMEEALELSELVLATDAGYGNAYHLQGWIHLSQGRDHEAAAELEKAYEKTSARFGSAFHGLIGGDLAALYYAGVAYEKCGEQEKAQQVFRKLLEQCEQKRRALSEQERNLLPGIQTSFLQGFATLRLGAADVDELAPQLESEVDRYIVLYKQMARLYALQGDRERALDWLQKAIDRGDRKYQHIYDNPDFEDLRNLPRFHELITRYLL